LNENTAMIESRFGPKHEPGDSSLHFKDERDGNGHTVRILEIKAMMISVSILLCFVDYDADDGTPDDDCGPSNAS
jgi:hypothetical protein